VRAACAALPGSIETFPFDATSLVFKVGAVPPPPSGGESSGQARAAATRSAVWKMYALTGIDGDPVQLSLKCDPARSELLRAEYPAIQPGYHLNKRHWNTVTLDGTVPDAVVLELLRHSYDLVRASLPRDVRALIAAG